MTSRQLNRTTAVRNLTKKAVMLFFIGGSWKSIVYNGCIWLEKPPNSRNESLEFGETSELSE